MLSLQTYEDRHNLKFPNEIIKVIKKEGKWIYFDTEFGVCKKYIGEFGKTSYSVNSALNITQFLKNKFNKIHNNKYSYLEINYTTGNSKIKIVCNKHGIFEQKITAHLNGHGCKKCAGEQVSIYNKSNLEEFIEKANKIHNFKYNYSKVNYSLSINKITIICPIHGEFEQIANSHLQKFGCNKCGFEHVGKINSKNPTGWTLSNWIKSAKKSKKFDSFKVYIIKCWNENEEFYKIGRTFLTIENRFNYLIPYKYKIIKIYENTAKVIYDLENKLKNKNKIYKYSPLLKFNGSQECFNKLKN